MYMYILNENDGSNWELFILLIRIFEPWYTESQVFNLSQMIME